MWFKASNLWLCITLSSGNDSTSMTHSSTWWSSLTSDETNNWKISMVILWKPFSSLLFCFSTNFSNHNYTLSFWIINETWEDINKVSSIKWISSNSYNSWLSKTVLSGLVDSLIGQCSWSWDNTDFTFLMDISWHNTDFAFSWLNNSWAVWSNKSGCILRVHDWLNLNHIKSWNSFCDTDNEIHFCFYCFQDSICGEWWWDVDDGGFSASGCFTFRNITENW